MSSSPTLTIGTIGAGNVAQAIAGHAIAAGHRVILSNSRGPESLAEVVTELGPNASAGTVHEAAAADIVLLAVRWEQVADAVKDVDLSGRIVVDTTNQWDSAAGRPLTLEGQTGTERNAALLPGARLVKAFNTLYARIVKLDPVRDGGRLVVFVAGDDAEAKTTVSAFIDGLGFAAVDVGGLQDSRPMQMDGGALSALHAYKVTT